MRLRVDSRSNRSTLTAEVRANSVEAQIIQSAVLAWIREEVNIQETNVELIRDIRPLE